MTPDQPSPVSAVHRLLFQALVEIREQGRETKNSAVFHLADLFHTAVLDMEAAARGERSFESVMQSLERSADEKGLDRWIATTLADLAKRQAQSPAVA